MNACKANLMTTEERLSEVAEILATGLMRQYARKSNPLSADGGDSSLDCPAHHSGHGDVLTSHGGSHE